MNQMRFLSIKHWRHWSNTARDHVMRIRYMHVYWPHALAGNILLSEGIHRQSTCLVTLSVRPFVSTLFWMDWPDLWTWIDNLNVSGPWPGDSKIQSQGHSSRVMINGKPGQDEIEGEECSTVWPKPVAVAVSNNCGRGNATALSITEHSFWYLPWKT